MDSTVITGAFALGGVALGGCLDWFRSSVAARHGAAGERDQVFAALATACVQLQAQAQMWRTLDKPGSRLRQIGYGVLESQARNPFAIGMGTGSMVNQLLASAAVNGLKHMFPVSVADRFNRDLLPLLSEISVLCVRMSMAGDGALKDASARLSDAAGNMITGIEAKDSDFVKRAEELQAALGQMRRARDAAAAPRWRRRAARRRIIKAET